VKSYRKESFPESQKRRKTAGSDHRPTPAGGKYLVMHPDCLKHTESGAGYCPGNQPELGRKTLFITPPVEEYRSQFRCFLDKTAEEYLGYAGEK